MAGKAFNIENCVLYYSRLNEPVLKYKKKADPDVPYKNKEYTIQIVIPTKTMKKLKKEYKKSVRAFQYIQELTAEEFKKKMKADAPDPKIYANDDGEFEVIRFNAHALGVSGTPNKKPQVIGAKVKVCKDLDGNTIKQDTLIGNGSVGVVRVKERTVAGEEGSGIQLDLKAVQIHHLVAYEEEDEVMFEDMTTDDDFDEEPEEDFVDHTEEDDEPDPDIESDDDDEEWDEDED